MPHSCLHLVMHNLGVLGEQTTQRGTSILLLTGNPVQWRTAWLSCAKSRIKDRQAQSCASNGMLPSGPGPYTPNPRP